MRNRRDELDLLLHPARIRIVHAFAGGGTRTTSELCARLTGVSQATVYRHVALLADAGVLEVVDERSVRGAIERRYRLNRDQARIDDDDAAGMTIDDHRRAFTAALAALAADFGAYLEQARANPLRDRVGYRQIPLWLTDEEQAQLMRGLERLIAPRLRNRPRGDRRPYLFSPIVFPVANEPHRHDAPTTNGA